MKVFKDLYDRSPVPLQNLAVTLYGYLLRRRRYGGNFQKYVAELEENQWLTSETLKQIQLRRLKNMIEHAYANVPYYRELFNRQGLSPKDVKTIGDLEKIPVLEKETVRKSHADFIARNFPKRGLIKEHTGGTTGSPLTIYMTREALQYSYAMTEARIRNWYGVQLGDSTAAFLGRTIVPIKQKYPPFWRYNKAWNECLFSIFHIKQENTELYMNKLTKLKPAIIIGYPTPIYMLACSINKAHLEGFIKPKLIWLSSETLQDHHRTAIEKAFATKVCNAYGLAEGVACVSECPQGGLHISPEYGVLEFLPIRGREEKGLYEVIATGLSNYAMPFVRYRTGDSVTLTKKKCACGRELPLIDRIIGRNDSVLITPGGACISSAPLSLVFESCINVEEAQIIQNARDHITVRVVRRDSYGQQDEKYLDSELSQRIGKEVRIDFSYANEIERTNMGKYRFLISEVSNEASG